MENQQVSTVTKSGVDITNEQQMIRLNQFAQVMAAGVATIPKHLQGNASDCMAVAMQAMRWGMDPYIVAQKTHLVSGTLGYEAQLVNAIITSSTAIEGRFHYEYSEGPWLVKGKEQVNKDDRVRVGAKLRGEDEIQWGEWLYPAHVATKNSPLWQQSGAGVKQQAAYLALKYWARLYTPQVIQGVYTPDELQEAREIKDITPKSALKIPSEKDESIIQSVSSAGAINDVDTETGEVMEADLIAVDDIIKAMLDAKNISELNTASAGASAYDKESSEYKEMRSFFLQRKRILSEQECAE